MGHCFTVAILLSPWLGSEGDAGGGLSQWHLPEYGMPQGAILSLILLKYLYEPTCPYYPELLPGLSLIFG